jgi:DNA repair protein RecO (recombination protein O)
VARGVRKIKSRVAGHVEPFSRVELMLAEGKKMDVVTSARLTSYPHGLADDYGRLSCAFTLAQMIDRLTPEGHAQPELFELMINAFEQLRRPVAPELTEVYVKLRTLSILGYRPQLEQCVVCGSTEVVTVDAERGGSLCEACRGAIPVMPGQQLKLWRLILRYDLGVLQKVGDAAPAAAASLEQLDRFYDHYFGRRFTKTMETVQ